MEEGRRGAGAAARELGASKVGRRARGAGKVETVVPEPAAEASKRTAAKPRPAWLESKGPALASETYETARLRHPGYDVYFVEAEWRAWSKGKEAAKDPDRAFLAFFRKYAEAHPL